MRETPPARRHSRPGNVEAGELPRACVRNRRGVCRRGRRPHGRRHARNPHADAETAGRRRPERRRSSSTSASAPIPRRSRSGGRANLYNDGKRSRAAPIFARYGSLEAQVGAALAAWPRRLRRARRHRADASAERARRSSTTGSALYWQGDLTRRKPRGGRRGRRSPTRPTPSARKTSSTRASRGGCRRSSRASRAGGARPSVAAGAARLPEAAGGDGRRAREAPVRRRAPAARPPGLGASASSTRRRRSRRNDPEAQVAAAVGRFDKANPSLTFSRLGPLAKRFPKSQSVRFHLGLCLLWLGTSNEAKQQLRLARDARAAHAARVGGRTVPREARRNQDPLTRR